MKNKVIKSANALNQTVEYKALFDVVSKIANCKEAQAFLTDLCTPAELQAMADRWQIVPLLYEGLSYRKIHDKTGVSLTTIGRVARFITHGSDGYQLIYERMKNEK